VPLAPHGGGALDGRSSTTATWTESRPAPSLIWCRQLVPSATTTEAVCEETTDEVVLMKDAAGRVIGFEVLNYRPASSDARVSIETVVHAVGT
jgi:hypothetical protein